MSAIVNSVTVIFFIGAAGIAHGAPVRVKRQGLFGLPDLAGGGGSPGTTDLFGGNVGSTDPFGLAELFNPDQLLSLFKPLIGGSGGSSGGIGDLDPSNIFGNLGGGLGGGSSGIDPSSLFGGLASSQQQEGKSNKNIFSGGYEPRPQNRGQSRRFWE